MATECKGGRAGEGGETRRGGIPSPLRERYPVFFAFGDEPTKFLTHEEAIAATPQQRIQSVWPFLAKAVLGFEATLRPRERANFDAEDVLTELYVKLMEKDGKWQPERGRYITFVARVSSNEFIKLRDRTRTVRSPVNSYCRLKEYEAEESSETISPERLRTLGALRRAICNAETLDGGESLAREAPGPDEEAERREDLMAASDAVAKAIMGLTASEASEIGQAYGLWGQHERPLDEIATSRGYTRAAVKGAQDRARRKMRERLEAMQHPAAMTTDRPHDEERT